MPTMPIQQRRDIIQMNGLISDEPIRYYFDTPLDMHIQLCTDVEDII